MSAGLKILYFNFLWHIEAAHFMEVKREVSEKYFELTEPPYCNLSSNRHGYATWALMFKKYVNNNIRKVIHYSLTLS